MQRTVRIELIKYSTHYIAMHRDNDRCTYLQSAYQKSCMAACCEGNYLSAVFHTVDDYLTVESHWSSSRFYLAVNADE